MKSLIPLALLVTTTLVVNSSARAADPPPYEINAILPLTGAGAFIGTAQSETLHVVEAVVNKGGGIQGRPLKFLISDDQSNPQVSVQLANTIISTHAPIIIGSSLVAMCSALAPIVQKSGPIDYCLSPTVPLVPGGYVFAASRGSDDQVIMLMRIVRERGWKRIAVITGTDATGQDFDRFFDAAMALPENQDLQVVERAHFAPTDVSVAAQMTRIKGAAPQVLVTYTTGTPFGTILRGIRDVGLDVPVTASGGNMSYQQMGQYTGLVPRQLYFIAVKSIVPDPGLRKGPIRDAQATYFSALKSAGIRPDFLHNLPWDPAMLVVDALRHTGADANAATLHAYIEQLHDWVGIGGVYDFHANPQRGLGLDALTLYRWDDRTKDFVIAGKQ